jgi:hypothetical protein
MTKVQEETNKKKKLTHFHSIPSHLHIFFSPWPNHTREGSFRGRIEHPETIFRNAGFEKARLAGSLPLYFLRGCLGFGFGLSAAFFSVVVAGEGVFTISASSVTAIGMMPASTAAARLAPFSTSGLLLMLMGSRRVASRTACTEGQRVGDGGGVWMVKVAGVSWGAELGRLPLTRPCC